MGIIVPMLRVTSSFWFTFPFTGGAIIVKNKNFYKFFIQDTYTVKNHHLIEILVFFD